MHTMLNNMFKLMHLKFLHGGTYIITTLIINKWNRKYRYFTYLLINIDIGKVVSISLSINDVGTLVKPEWYSQQFGVVVGHQHTLCTTEKQLCFTYREINLHSTH